MSSQSESPSDRFRHITSLLRFADNSLKENPNIEAPALLEFRQTLDNIRLTAWTASELQNARETNKDACAMMSFLTSERLRRFRQMIDDFCTDLERDGVAWPSTSIHDLKNSVTLLLGRLNLMGLRAGHNKS